MLFLDKNLKNSEEKAQPLTYSQADLPKLHYF